MRVERSAKRNANLAWVRHFDSRIARQIVQMNEPYEATLLYDMKSRPRCDRKLVLLSILVMVEPIGIEPMTLCLQSRCSPS